MKLKYKLILDMCMAILLVICMKYNFTGGLLHEILGTLLIMALIWHVILNRKYYTGMFRKKNKNNRNLRHTIIFVVYWEME